MTRSDIGLLSSVKLFCMAHIDAISLKTFVSSAKAPIWDDLTVSGSVTPDAGQDTIFSSFAVTDHSVS